MRLRKTLESSSGERQRPRGAELQDGALCFSARFWRRSLLYYALPLILVSAAAFAEPFVAASVTSTTLDNGLKVILMEDHSAELVALDVWVKAGNLFETKDNSGAAHFLEHTLFKGTANRPQGQTDREIESLGASLDASTSRDAIKLRTVVSSKYFDLALDVITDVAMRAKLDPQAIDMERPIILDEISRRDTNPLQAVATLVAKASFPDHPYGRPIEGDSENVRVLTADQIRSFYNTYFVPNNMAVVIVGDVNPTKATEAVRAAFGTFKKKDLPPRQTPAVPPLTAVKTEKVTRSTKITYSALSFPAPGIRDLVDVCAMDLIVEHMAGDYRGWLQTLKPAKTEVQVISADYLTRRDPGNIMFMFGVDSSAVDEVRQMVLTKLKQMKETPLSDAEIAAAKRATEGNYAFETETVAGRANILGFYEALGDYKLALSYIDTIRKLTPEQVRQTAAKYFNIDAYVIAEVGP